MKKKNDIFRTELIKSGERMIFKAPYIEFFNRGKWRVYGNRVLSESSRARIDYICQLGKYVNHGHYVFPERLS